MKRLLYVGILLTSLTIACKEESLMLFDDKTSSNSIYFPAAESNNTYALSFGYVKTFTQDSIIRIVVRAIGNVSNEDRGYNLTIADSSTMKVNIDYSFLNEDFSIKAGKVADTLKIKLNRTEAMKSDSLFLYMDLKPNAHFSNAFLSREEKSNGKIITKYFTRLKLKVDDIAGVPWFWDPTRNTAASTYIGYLGTFGTNKFQLLISRYNLDTQLITAANYRPGVSQLIGWANGLKAYIDQMAAIGTPVYETDGSLMKMGQYAR